MSITDIHVIGGLEIVAVDHDPTTGSTDVPCGSRIFYQPDKDDPPFEYIKDVGGDNTSVSLVNPRMASLQASAPGVTDDMSKRYGPGSIWPTVAGKIYMCTVATKSAAVWKELSLV